MGRGAPDAPKSWLKTRISGLLLFSSRSFPSRSSLYLDSDDFELERGWRGASQPSRQCWGPADSNKVGASKIASSQLSAGQIV